MIATHPPTALETSALTAAAPIILALQECSPELRAEALDLFADLNSGELDAYERTATLSMLAEILFPNADPEDTLPGLDLEKAEQLAPSQNPEAKEVLDAMDHDESTFAFKVKERMDALNITQAELAEKVGIGQPAVSMMLQRNCRPQRKTVLRFAEALSVPAEELWPSLRQ